MKDEAALTFLHKVALAVASATVVGGGSMVLTAHTNLATQEVRIERVEKAVEKIDALSEKLDETNLNLQLLNAKMEARAAHESRQ